MIVCKQTQSSLYGKWSSHCRDDGGLAEPHRGGHDLLPEFGDLVFEGATDLVEQAMFAESPNGSGHLRARPVRKMFTESAGIEATDKVFAAYDSQGQVEIGRRSRPPRSRGTPPALDDPPPESIVFPQ